MKHRIPVLAVATSALLLWSGAAKATVLTFTPQSSFGVGGGISDNYGDNVDWAGDPGPRVTVSGYEYGTAGGQTPNIAATYEGSGGQDLKFYTGSLFSFPDSGCAYDNVGSIILDADSGWSVRITSFDMGGWVTDPMAAYPLDFIKVLDVSNNVLWEVTAPMITGLQPYALDVSAPTLTLQFSDPGGGWIGISNIQFSQVPEPATLALVSVGALALLRRKR